MRLSFFRFVAAAVGLVFMAASPRAATLTVVGGQLTGATGVVVSGLGTFDVSFIDNSCVNVFGGCNEPSDFDFTTSADASAAAQALLDQVFLNTTAGNFDTDPEITLGCINLDRCKAFIPFANIFQNTIFQTISAINRPFASGDQVGNSNFSISENFALDDDGVLVDFDLVLTVVPLPAALPLYGTGLAVMGFIGWRRKRKALAAA